MQFYNVLNKISRFTTITMMYYTHSDSWLKAHWNMIRQSMFFLETINAHIWFIRTLIAICGYFFGSSMRLSPTHGFTKCIITRNTPPSNQSISVISLFSLTKPVLLVSTISLNFSFKKIATERSDNFLFERKNWNFLASELGIKQHCVD